MNKFDDMYFLNNLDAIGESLNHHNYDKEYINKLINNLIKQDDCYSNTLLAIYYHDKNVRMDNNLSFQYLLKASKQGSSFADACLSLCYKYGWVIDIDEDKSNEYLTKFINNINEYTLTIEEFNYFINILKECTNFTDIEIENLFAKEYIKLFNIIDINVDLQTYDYRASCQRQVTRHLKQAQRLGDKTAYYNLCKYLKDVFKDEESANIYLKLAVKDGNETQ